MSESSQAVPSDLSALYHPVHWNKLQLLCIQKEPSYWTWLGSFFNEEPELNTELSTQETNNYLDQFNYEYFEGLDNELDLILSPSKLHPRHPRLDHKLG